MLEDPSKLHGNADFFLINKNENSIKKNIISKLEVDDYPGNLNFGNFRKISDFGKRYIFIDN